MIGSGKRLWAENLGGATVTAGLQFTGPNGEVHGLHVNVSQATHGKLATAQGGYMGIYSSDSGLKVSDTYVTGNRRIKWLSGIRTGTSQGIDIQRVVIKDSTYNGIELDGGGSPSISPHLADVDINYVMDSDSPESLNGTAESGIWTSTRVNAERIRVLDAAWMGITTQLNSVDSVYHDIRIDGQTLAHTGFYFEHMSTRITLDCFYIGPHIGSVHKPTGVYWSQGIVAECGSSKDLVIKNGIIDNERVGIDACDAQNTTVKNVIFKNQKRAAIQGGIYNKIIDCDFSSMAPGAISP